MKPYPITTWLVLAFSALLLGACSSIETMAEWKDPEYRGGAVKSFLVVGVSDNLPARRRFEDEFAAKLQAFGAQASASYKVLGEDIEPSAEAVEKYLEDASQDAILVTHLIGSEERSLYTPPSWEPVPRYYSSYRGYYGTVHDYVYRPGYYTQHEFLQLETNLYRAGDGVLIWSMQSQSIDPESADRLIDDLIELATKRMQDQGLL
jgi:hypothetical protein